MAETTGARLKSTSSYTASIEVETHFTQVTDRCVSSPLSCPITVMAAKEKKWNLPNRIGEQCFWICEQDHVSKPAIYARSPCFQHPFFLFFEHNIFMDYLVISYTIPHHICFSFLTHPWPHSCALLKKEKNISIPSCASQILIGMWSNSQRQTL